MVRSVAAGRIRRRDGSLDKRPDLSVPAWRTTARAKRQSIDGPGAVGKGEFYARRRGECAAKAWAFWKIERRLVRRILPAASTAPKPRATAAPIVIRSSAVLPTTS